MMTIEGYDGDRVLLSYDVSGAVARAVAARLCQIIFGRRRVSEGSAKVAYQEKGFIHRPGVVWVGQSVLLKSPGDAGELPIGFADWESAWRRVRWRLPN